MRLWKRASGVLKDQNSLWITSLSRSTTLRNPDIEASVIKATNHDELRIDYKNFHRVLSWLRLSDVHVKPAVRCISSRLQKTRSWIVAVKGLMLMHGIVSTRISVVQLIGRLPFDLSNFKDGHTKLGKIWAHNAFIRAYYAFLDCKSSLLYSNLREITASASSTAAGKQSQFSIIPTTATSQIISRDVMLLQKVQYLLDLLLQIKPQSTAAANVFLIVEAMDGIVMESFDIYSKMCKMISNIVSRVMDDGNDVVLTRIIVRVVEKAVDQGQQLSLYFEVCREIGVEKALEIPDPPKINDRDIQLLKQMVLHHPHSHDITLPENQKPRKKLQGILISITPRQQQQQQQQEEKTKEIVAIDQYDQNSGSNNGLRTIITDNWEKFDEDNLMLVPIESSSSVRDESSYNTHKFHYEVPDLISFL